MYSLTGELLLINPCYWAYNLKKFVDCFFLNSPIGKGYVRMGV